MNRDLNKDKIIVIDFGSQVTKLIARRIREHSVLSEVITLKDLKKKNFTRTQKVLFYPVVLLLSQRVLFLEYQTKYSI